MSCAKTFISKADNSWPAYCEILLPESFLKGGSVADSSGTPGTRKENRQDGALTDRREFVKKAGKVAVTAPAAALLLSLAAKRANADTITTSIAGTDTFADPP
jgi:hypothetical protein